MGVERLEGHPADLHGRPLEPVDALRVQVLVPTAPALVLGSTQDGAEVDAEVARRLGLSVVRRRSGGGAVLVAPDDPVWVDVDLPRGDPRWQDDVGRSAHWLGAVWAEVLAGHGLAARAHGGAYEPGPWGRRICFAGRGPGEVFVAGAKVVGIAQRRTRAVARFQCAVPRRWDPGPLVDLLVPAAERARATADLVGVATGVAVDPEALVEGLVGRLAAD